MSVQLTPSKRSHEPSNTGPNGQGKRQKSSDFTSQTLPVKFSTGTTIFRLLCPSSKIGSVIGKGGSIISKIRKETGTNVNVKTIFGCDERVIVIQGSNKDGKVGVDLIVGEGDDASKHAVDEEDNHSILDLQSESGTSSIMKALLLVFERIVEREYGGDEERIKSSTFIMRLLVLSRQVGCLLEGDGPDGSVIKQMSSDSGADIGILPWYKLPPTASLDDELVQLRALQSFSQQLLENPPCDYTVEPLLSRLDEKGIHGLFEPSWNILNFQLLCHVEKVGLVIGKEGTIVNKLQRMTGCDIHVLNCVPDSEYCIVFIGGPVFPNDRISASQKAVLLVQSRIVRAASNSKENTVTAELLVSSNEKGCLIGVCGAIVSGASIGILGKYKLPKCAAENEVVVQINGEFEAVQDALLHVTTRLQKHFFGHGLPAHEGFLPLDDPAMTTETTVKVGVPTFLVPTIYGEHGECLKQIREFSDARVTIIDPDPGATKAEIVIFGTPEQRFAAESLIRAFVELKMEAP